MGAFTACDDEDNTNDLNALSRTYEGKSIELKMGEVALPNSGKSVVLNAAATDKAQLTLNNILPENSSLTLDASLASTGDTYTFNGEGTTTDGTVTVNGTVKPSDVHGISGDKFVVYEHFTGEYSIVGYEEEVQFSLKDIDDYRLFVIVPYVNDFAAIGLIDKFISPASITAQIGEAVTLYESGRYAYVKNGRLVIEER